MSIYRPKSHTELLLSSYAYHTETLRGDQIRYLKELVYYIFESVLKSPTFKEDFENLEKKCIENAIPNHLGYEVNFWLGEAMLARIKADKKWEEETRQ